MRPRRLAAATALFLLVQARSGFVHVYALVSIATVLFVRALLPETWRPIVVPAVLLGEYGTMGVFMVGGLHYLGRIEGSAAALVVSPLTHREQVVAMILAPALVATPAGLLVHVGLLGLDESSLLLVPPLLLTTWIAGACGLALASRYADFTQFLVAAIPVVTVFSLPYLSLFDVVPRFTFVWLPWDAALFSFADLALRGTEAMPYALRLFELLAFGGLFFRLAERALEGVRRNEAAA